MFANHRPVVVKIFQNAELAVAQKLYRDGYFPNWFEKVFEEALVYMLHTQVGVRMSYVWSKAIRSFEKVSSAEYQKWRDCTAVTGADVSCQLNVTWYSNVTQGEPHRYFICRQPSKFMRAVVHLL